MIWSIWCQFVEPSLWFLTVSIPLALLVKLFAIATPVRLVPTSKPRYVLTLTEISEAVHSLYNRPQPCLYRFEIASQLRASLDLKLRQLHQHHSPEY